jgi:hypothetical protein
MSNKSTIPTVGQQPQLLLKSKSHQQQQQLLARGSPYGLLQSARRRLQCSQLPVRSASLRQQQDCKLTSSLHKFPVLGTPRHQVSRSARKSLSLVDLSPTLDYDKPEFRWFSSTDTLPCILSISSHLSTITCRHLQY